MPGLEGKMPSFDNKPGLDNPGVFDPGRFGRGAEPQAAPARPFVLATPHHAGLWQGEAQQAQARLAEMEAMLARLEQAMAATEAHLAQLDADYRQLLAEYQALGGGAQYEYQRAGAGVILIVSHLADEHTTAVLARLGARGRADRGPEHRPLPARDPAQHTPPQRRPIDALGPDRRRGARSRGRARGLVAAAAAV